MSYPAPDVRNFTRAGGIALYVDGGSGFEHLGNIDISKMSAEPKNDELEIETQLSGESRTAETMIIKRAESYKFPLQEITPENLQRFFCGGDITPVGPDTAAVVDQKMLLAGELPASLGKYAISAVTVRQFLDACLVYASAAYTDRSEEADSQAGTPFDLLNGSGEFVYFGKAMPFQEIYLDLATPGSYTGVVWEYWNGAAWTTLTTAGAGDDLDADGKVNWTIPGAWATKIVNGSAPLYWVRVKCSTKTTTATCNCVRQDAVRNTDYIIDPGQVSGGLLAGRIGRLAAGFLADGEEVMVSFTHTTWESLIFPVGTVQYPQVAARIDYLTLKGTKMRRHIFKCQLKPDGAISFDPKKELQIPLMLVVLDDYANNPTQPYGYKEILA